MAKTKKDAKQVIAEKWSELSLARAERRATRELGRVSVRERLADASPGKIAVERRRLALKRREEIPQRIALYNRTYDLMAQSRPALKPPLRILAEGDSWFNYPRLRGGGVVYQLERLLEVPILNLAQAGDEVRFMLGVKQREVLARELAQAAGAGALFDALLFSGGGNDVVDEPLCLWLREFAGQNDPKDLIATERLAAILAVVRAGYEDLIALRDRLSPKTTIFCHGYDFAIPDGRGICHLGPWLKPSLAHRGVPEHLRRGVIEALLVRFAEMLAALASHTQRMVVVPTQGALAGHDDWWDNELHPTGDGFGAVAERFVASLQAAFPGKL